MKTKCGKRILIRVCIAALTLAYHGMLALMAGMYDWKASIMAVLVSLVCLGAMRLIEGEADEH